MRVEESCSSQNKTLPRLVLAVVTGFPTGAGAGETSGVRGGGPWPNVSWPTRKQAPTKRRDDKDEKRSETRVEDRRIERLMKGIMKERRITALKVSNFCREYPVEPLTMNKL